MNSKVLLILANSRWYGKRPWVFVPFNALILTDILKREFSFDILDANGLDLSEEECQKRILEYRPEIVLVSALSFEYYQQFHKAIALAKEACPDAITIMGGVHPTVLGNDVLKDENVDYIFQGHAEERLVDFLRLILSGDKNSILDFPGIGFRTSSGAIKINPVQSYIADVKKMAKVDYSLIDLEPYLIRETRDYQINSKVTSASIMTSYGCPYNCVFCATRTISGRRIAYRPIEDVLEEIDFLVNEHDIQELVFVDDCFLAKKKRVSLFFQELLERNYNLTWKAATVAAWHLDDELLELMKKSGCTQITISVESGSPRVLHEIIRKPLKLEIIPPITKKCKELGIDFAVNFIIGFPGETWEDIRTTIRFAEEGDFDLVHFHIATPLPETDLFHIARDQGLLPADFNFLDAEYFGFGQGFISTDKFTAQELMILRAYEWDRINFKTKEKTAKVAQMYHVTLEELEEHRKQTRHKVGVVF